MPKISTTKSVTAHAPKKVRTVKKKERVPEVKSPIEPKVVHHPAKIHQPKPAAEKYIFSTGRRKTSIANVRLFEGHGQCSVNKKPFENYFQYSYYQEKALKPFAVTGLEKRYHFTAHISGGGIHAQAHALSHGLARGLASVSEEIKKVLKKNGFLTRDDRVKERKKPGLKRARRSPQWAKR